MSELILQCHGLAKTYQGLDTSVLTGVDLQLAAGDHVAIVGASGSGKSTLLHLLGGLDAPTQGEVAWLGKPLASLSERDKSAMRNQYLGFVYQFHHLLPEFSALENVAMPLLIRRMPRLEALAQAEHYLSLVGLSHRLEHTPGELSGGERQRAALARALVTQPRCILADEPTGNLDRQTAEQVFELLLHIQSQQGTALVVVTHDLALAARMHRQYRLQDGVLQTLAAASQDVRAS
ncbi:lipoprotein-releasing ABC transporter ATP-binding protein LolD [Methylophilus sp.]|jgi:lipoprotein-releasing system ATP-binding protein|uniref:lipoprotein-releasing ABC transporter ATP-binding protein LolD n=1 Tax=Methylophilus sp. TaxID=29541 RepID=UPI0011D315A8|nr:lipoprotein-releasing ABC transporter ATP-binding protein LolD [Methylophilus sp.]TXI46555.1 MAG: lipoprotein-releasing ABC transporter ATP-binding protein LolD [Methylophilus sp.]